MGQQQLLLVILVTIIVGVATVVAINVFGESANNANVDATRQDVLTIAALAQGWYTKPALLGGGGSSFTGVDADKLGFGYDSGTPTAFTNANATYTIDGTAGTNMTISAVPIRAGGTVATTVYANSIDDITY